MEIKCTAWISSQEKHSSVERQECYLIPSLQELLSQDDDEFTQYPYDETWDQAKDDTVCIIHTSGTTGTSHQNPESILVKKFCLT
jgi:long-subunit acyl-CoA synthetase (AMP-forming)